MTILPSGDTEVGTILPFSTPVSIEGALLPSAGAQTRDVPLDGA